MGGYLIIEAIEKKTGQYPIISELQIQIRSTHGSYFNLCHERRKLQVRLWNMKNTLEEEEVAQIDLSIRRLDERLSAVSVQYDNLFDGKDMQTLECHDFTPMNDLIIQLAPW